MMFKFPITRHNNCTYNKHNKIELSTKLNFICDMLDQSLFFGRIWSSWKFHNNKQMFCNLLHTLLTPKEERNAISYTQVFFLKYIFDLFDKYFWNDGWSSIFNNAIALRKSTMNAITSSSQHHSPSHLHYCLNFEKTRTWNCVGIVHVWNYSYSKPREIIPCIF